MGFIFTFIFYIMLAIIESEVVKRLCNARLKKNRNIYFILSVLLPSLFAAMRGETGSDSLMYRIAYEQGSIHRWVDFEIGYNFLMKIMRMLKLPYQALFFVVAMIIMTFVIFSIYKKREVIDVKISTFIFMVGLYLFSFNGMRQSLAISICILAIIFLSEGKLIRSIFLILLASTFHLSALICLGVIVFKYALSSKYYKQILVIIVLVVFYFITHRKLLGEIILWVTGSSYYAGYVIRDATIEANIFMYFIKALPVLLIGFLDIRYYKLQKDMYQVYAVVVVGYIIGAMGTMTDTQVGRLGDYFEYLNIILMGFCATKPLPIGNKNVLSAKTTTQLIYVYFFLMMIYNTFLRNFSDLVPYGLFRS